MASISTLFVELKLSAENFNNGLKEAQREAKEFEKNLKPTLTVTKDLGVAMTAAGGVITAAFGAASKAAIDYGDKLNDARQRTGATVETLAKLGFAAEQSGSSFEGLSNGLRFLARNMEAAIAKTGDQRAAFNALGISSQDLVAANGDINKTFLLLADRFKELPDGAEKSALAMRVFGKSGADLIPLLNEGSAGIRKFGDDAQKAGLLVSQDFASAADQLNETLNEVKASAMGVSIGIAQSLLPTLQSAASFAADAGRQFAAFSKEHPGLIQAAGALGIALVGVGSALTTIAVIVPKLQSGYLLLTAALSGPGGLVVAIGAAVLAIGSIVYAMKLWHDAEKNLTAQTEDLAASQARAAKSLQEHGIQIRLDQIPVERRTEALAKLGQQLVQVWQTTGPLIDSTELAKRGAERHAAAVKAQTDALEKAKRAAEDLRVTVAAIQTPLGDWADAVHEYGDQWRRFFDILKVNLPTIRFATDDFRTFEEAVRDATADIDLANDSLDGLNQNVRDILSADPGVQLGGGFEKAAESAKKIDDSFNSVKHTATNVFRDILRDGELSFTKLGGIIKGIFETIASEILGSMTAALITPLVNRISGALNSVLGNIPGLGGVFGGVGSAAGGVASAGGGAASGAGSLASGATGILGGVVGGGIAAAGSLLGSARLEGTMNAVEANTRFTYIQLRDTMDLILQPMLARLEDIKAELFNHKYVPDILTSIWAAISDVSGAGLNFAGPAIGGQTATSSRNAVGAITINVYQTPGEDGGSFARRVAEELNRYVQHGGGTLLASGLA